MLKYVQAFRNALQLLKNGFNNEPLLMLNMIEGTGSKAASFTIQDLMGDGMLWGVPKKRPTKDNRVWKRFGHPRYQHVTKLLRPREDLIVCETCGDHHEVFAICRTCYKEVKEETDKIMKSIKEQNNPLEPREREVFLKYENENPENVEQVRIVELDRPRPAWFAPNLMTKARQLGEATKAAISGNDTPVMPSRTPKK